MQYHVGEFPTLTDFAASLTDNLDTSGCCGPKPKIVNEMTAQMKRAKSDVEKRLLRFIEQNEEGSKFYSFQVRGGCMIVVLAQLSRHVLLAYSLHGISEFPTSFSKRSRFNGVVS